MSTPEVAEQSSESKRPHPLPLALQRTMSTAEDLPTPSRLKRHATLERQRRLVGQDDTDLTYPEVQHFSFFSKANFIQNFLDTPFHLLSFKTLQNIVYSGHRISQDINYEFCTVIVFVLLFVGNNLYANFACDVDSALFYITHDNYSAIEVSLLMFKMDV